MTDNDLTFESFAGIPLDWERTKGSHPYQYGPYLIFDTGQKGTSSAYSDRLQQQDSNRFYACREKVGIKGGDGFDHVRGYKIEAFLRAYFDAPNLRLCRVEEHCNQANGYPYWWFLYKNA